MSIIVVSASKLGAGFPSLRMTQSLLDAVSDYGRDFGVKFSSEKKTYDS